MISVFVISTAIFVLRMIVFAIEAAWSIFKTVFFVIGIPVVLIGLLVAGIMTIALPLLGIALLGAFLLPVIRRRIGLL